MPENEDRALAEAIYKTFRTEDGKVVLSYLMIEAGFFEDDIRKMKPDCIALVNRLLKAGHMTASGNMGIYATAVVESYDASDLSER